MVLRTCLGCMARDRKDAMVRIAMRDGMPVADFEMRAPGRGGYLHRRLECLERFVRSKAKEFRSLRARISPEHRRLLVQAIRERLDREAALE